MHFSWSRNRELALIDRSCSRATFVFTRVCRVFSASINLSLSLWMVSSISLTSVINLRERERQGEQSFLRLILQNISCLYMYRDIFMANNTNIGDLWQIGYLWWGLSLQSSTLGLRDLSSRRVWATLSGFSLSRIAFFKASISISVWKISWRVWKQESKREKESWLNKWQSHLFSVSDFRTLLKVKTVQSDTLISTVYIVYIIIDSLKHFNLKLGWYCSILGKFPTNPHSHARTKWREQKFRNWTSR